MQFVTITSQGQITIPAKMRRELGLDKLRKAIVRRENTTIIIESTSDFFSLKGSVKKKKYSDKKSGQQIGTFIADEYEKETNNS